jgi:hypothetical protein
VRFECPSYIPRFTDFEADDSHECIIIGSDVVDQDALRLTGVEYKALQSGGWMLEAGLTYVGRPRADYWLIDTNV